MKALEKTRKIFLTEALIKFFAGIITAILILHFSYSEIEPGFKIFIAITGGISTILGMRSSIQFYKKAIPYLHPEQNKVVTLLTKNSDLLKCISLSDWTLVKVSKFQRYTPMIKLIAELKSGEKEEVIIFEGFKKSVLNYLDTVMPKIKINYSTSPDAKSF